MKKVVISWSGGKDSAFALYELRKNYSEYRIVSLLVTLTEDYDRISMHGVRRALAEKQAQSAGLPLAPVLISRTCTETEYEARVNEELACLKAEGVGAVVFGDIYLDWLRKYREEKLSKLGLEALFPLWGRATPELAKSFIRLGFGAVTTCIDTRKLGRQFLGRVIDENFLAELPPDVDPAGEKGEFHSFVFRGPVLSEDIEFALGDRAQ